MKILDATILIAILDEINCPDLIDKIIKLGHDLVIPSHTLKNELVYKSTLKATNRFIKQEKIQISDLNSMEEIEEFQKSHNGFGLGLGECDSILSYKKLNGHERKVYCILDDKRARSKALELGIEFTGLVGLLKMIKDRNIMSSQEIDEVVQMLKNSKFRFPRDVVI